MVLAIWKMVWYPFSRHSDTLSKIVRSASVSGISIAIVCLWSANFFGEKFCGMSTIGVLFLLLMSESLYFGWFLRQYARRNLIQNSVTSVM